MPPVDNANYRIIHGRCIYFESQKLNYQSARTNCRTKVSGKLFEPTNYSENEKVHQAAMEVFGDLPTTLVKNVLWLNEGSRIWIGVNDLIEEGKFIYDKSQHSLGINSWFTNEPNNRNNEDQPPII